MHTSFLDASMGATHALALAVAAGVEGLAGLAMLIAPFIVTQLLGGDVLSVAVRLVRLGGAALLSLVIAAWPDAGSTAQSRRSLPLAGGGAARFPNSASRAHLGITNGGRAVMDDRRPDSVMIATGATPLRACPGVRTDGLASAAAMQVFS